MDVTSIGSFLQAVGFPIAACVAMGMYLKYITDAYREDTHKQDERYTQEIHALTEAITNNTVVMQKLVDKLDKGELADV